jgi:putative addiction module killer protein
MIEVRESDVFKAWFAGLRDQEARARIRLRVRRLSAGNPGDVKPVGKASLKCGSTMAQATGFIPFNAVRRS